MTEGTGTQSETVIVAEGVEVTAEEQGRAAKKTGRRQMPNWEADARDRVRVAVRRFARPLADLIARDANEGDTRLLVTDFLCDGLSYDKYEDLTTEYQVKRGFADYGVRIARQMVAFMEVKRAATKLGAKHLRQVEMYAVNEGVEWMILTNGQVWQAWHLTAGLPVALDLTLEVDLLGEGGPRRRQTPRSRCLRKGSSIASSTSCGGSRPLPLATHGTTLVMRRSPPLAVPCARATYVPRTASVHGQWR